MHYTQSHPPIYICRVNTQTIHLSIHVYQCEHAPTPTLTLTPILLHILLHILLRIFTPVHAPAHIPTQNGSSPLHMAAYRGHTTTAALLLQRGASITQEGEWGAALEYAREGKQTHTAEFLSRYIRTGDLRVLARPTQETIDGGAGQHKGDHRDTHTGTGSGEEEASRALSAHGEGKETTRIRSKL